MSPIDHPRSADRRPGVLADVVTGVGAVIVLVVALAGASATIELFGAGSTLAHAVAAFVGLALAASLPVATVALGRRLRRRLETREWPPRELGTDRFRSEPDAESVGPKPDRTDG